MNDNEQGQVNTSAAEVYEAFFLPALFQEWPPQVMRAAGLQPGYQVVDVACGTGVLTRAAAQQVVPGGSVIGVDINAGMLAVAKRQSPQIEWRQAPAEALPFDDQQFDAVVSQFGLMFFADRQTSIREMWRVLRSSGRLAVAVWDALDNTPGYAAMAQLLRRLFGAEIAQALYAPYNLGDRRALQAVFAAAGVPDVEIKTYTGTARFPSIRDWVYTDIKGWTLAEVLDDAQFERLQLEAERALQPFVTANGTVAFDSPAHIVSVTKM